MATSAATGATYDTTELTADRTGETSITTGEISGKTSARSKEIYAMEITGLPVSSSATSGTTGRTCEPTTAISGMTAVTSGTIAATFTATAKGNFAAALGGGPRTAAGESCRRVLSSLQPSALSHQENVNDTSRL